MNEDDYLEPIHFDEINKNNVSQKALATLEKVMLKQDNYGFQKYKKPLVHTMNYGWMQMFLEEMADGLKYIQNEMDRKQFVIELLENALEMDDPKSAIETALNLLKKDGTGK